MAVTIDADMGALPDSVDGSAPSLTPHIHCTRGAGSAPCAAVAIRQPPSPPAGGGAQAMF